MPDTATPPPPGDPLRELLTALQAVAAELNLFRTEVRAARQEIHGDLLGIRKAIDALDFDSGPDEYLHETLANLSYTARRIDERLDPSSSTGSMLVDLSSLTYDVSAIRAAAERVSPAPPHRRGWGRH